MTVSVRRPAIVAFALSLGVAGLITTAGAAQASFPSTSNGRIVFDSNSNNADRIYSVNPDGSQPRALTDGTASDLGPDVSADGRRIAFDSNRTGHYEIWTMNADGSDQTQLTSDNADDEYPAWSPDGTKIAYRMATSADAGDIYVIPVSGGTPVRLTTTPGLDSVPEWSPDGTKILFHSSRDDASPATCGPCVQSIYSMNADGSDQTQLVYTAGQRNRFPNWSPDGTHIVFERDDSLASSADSHIYTADADGSNVSEVAASAGQSDAIAPDWSPDGTQLVWSYFGDLYTVPVSGESSATQIPVGTYALSTDWSTIGTIPTTSATTLTSSAASSVYGQRETYTARVKSVGGVTAAPTGTVTFTLNGTQLGNPITLSKGAATRAITTAPAGSDTIVATYNGDSQHTPSSASITVQVSQAQTTVTPSVADGATITYGQPVTAKVKASAPSTAAIPASANGGIAYVDDTSTGPLKVSSSKITVPAAALTTGSHSLQICYNGTDNLNSSCSATINITVNQASTTTTLSSTPNPSTVGQKVTLTAKVTPRVTGTVAFYNDTTYLGQANLSYGAARITVKFASTGNQPLTATYNGNDNYESSTSAVHNQQVN